MSNRKYEYIAKHNIYFGAGHALVAKEGELVNVVGCGSHLAAVQIKGERGFTLRLFPEDVSGYVRKLTTTEEVTA